MTSIIVQPCSHGVPAEHYADTVAAPVPYESYASSIPAADLVQFKERFPGGPLAWPGGNVCACREARPGMRPGDIR